MATLGGIIADGPLAADVVSGNVLTVLPDALVLADAFTTFIVPGAVVTEAMKLIGTYGAQALLGVTMAEGIKLTSAYFNVSSVTLIQAFGLTDAYLPQVNIVLRETIRLMASLSTSELTSLSLQERVRVLEALQAFSGLVVADHLEVTDGPPLFAYIAGVSLGEQLALFGQMQDKLVIRLQVSDEYDLGDDPLANFIWSTAIVENVVADVLYQSPGAGVTSFAINTRTNALSEYRNFQFNSFAAMGRKFIAADDTGLYELNGARDLTEDVIAQIAGGYFQFNNSKFAGLKGVYLGVHGQGHYLLKIVTGDGLERIYRTLSNPGMMTTKFNIGKGIRSRYLAWELVNDDGQDFDLDTIEFLPMVSARRV